MDFKKILIKTFQSICVILALFIAFVYTFKESPARVDEESYREGYQDGYDEGYRDGGSLTSYENEGKIEGIKQEAIKEGYAIGYEYGYEEGYIDCLKHYGKEKDIEKFLERDEWKVD